METETAPVLDKPWHRPGAVGYALSRLRGLARPPTRVYEPAPGALAIDSDVAVTLRDGTVLRVNVYRPPAEGRFPVLLSAHPYGKDSLPTKTRLGHRVSIQYRVLRQTGQVTFSTLTGWEAPDPVWWTERGYAIVNSDLRGAELPAARALCSLTRRGRTFTTSSSGRARNPGAPARWVSSGSRTWRCLNGRRQRYDLRA